MCGEGFLKVSSDESFKVMLSQFHLCFDEINIKAFIAQSLKMSYDFLRNLIIKRIE